MISQIKTTYELSVAEIAMIDAVRPFKPGDWERDDLQEIRAKIHGQLLTIQNHNCCYCGLKVNEGGRAEIDHIAKKGGIKRPAYTEFIYTPKNLAIACQFCNSSSKKGQEDVLLSVDLTDYEKCTFKIVHPYQDDPNFHYDWTRGKFKILIIAKTQEAIFSIKLFELHAEAHSLARAKQVMFETKLAKYKYTQSMKNRILEIMGFKR